MTLLGAITLGEHTRIEAREIRAALAGAPALARAEDRYHVLNADATSRAAGASAPELYRQATEQQSALGDVVVRNESPWVFDLVVYDLDCDRIVSEDDVALALDNLMDLLCRLQLDEIAIEPIGLAHGGISAERFANALVQACTRGPIGLRVLVCESETQILRRILDACARVQARTAIHSG